MKLLPYLFSTLLLCFSHHVFAELDFNDVLDTEDESMIMESLPLEEGVSMFPDATFDANAKLEAKPEDVFRAQVVAIINKSENFGSGQTIRVYKNGKIIYKWLVSTGREKFEKAVSGRNYWSITPVGYFRPTALEALHRSKLWGADMPNAVFFKGGVAVHEGHALEKLGMRASGGCVRVAAESAKLFFDLVSSVGVSPVTDINRDGTVKLDANGQPIKVNGYDVLIIVENPEAPTPVEKKP